MPSPNPPEFLQAILDGDKAAVLRFIRDSPDFAPNAIIQEADPDLLRFPFEVALDCYDLNQTRARRDIADALLAFPGTNPRHVELKQEARQRALAARKAHAARSAAVYRDIGVGIDSRGVHRLAPSLFPI